MVNRYYADVTAGVQAGLENLGRFPLRSWLEPIVRMWRFSESNGITEGLHTKMEMLSRRDEKSQ